MSSYLNEGSLELLASAARTASVATGEQINHRHKGLLLLINVTAAPVTPSVVPTIEVLIGSTWTAVAAGTAITATGQFSILLYPAATGGSFDDVIGVFLPPRWRLNMVHGDADTITYNVIRQLLI